MTEEALSSWQAPKRTTRGSQPSYSDLAIDTALTLGLVFGLRLRQTEGLLTSVLKLMGLDLAVPDHTTLSRRARTWRSADSRQGRSVPMKEPVHVLIDSTGLGSMAPVSRLEEKHGAKSRRIWRKLHLALDADSGEIIAHVLTDQDAGDPLQVKALLDRIDVPISQFTADGAYDGIPTYDAVARHGCDAAAVIPPRVNAVYRSNTGIDSQRDRHVAAINTDGRPMAVSTNERLPYPVTACHFIRAQRSHRINDGTKE
jgi:hypothetical protein